MVCPNCRREIKESNYCLYCGSQILEEEITTKTQKISFSKVRIGAIVGIVAVAILVFAALGNKAMISDEQFQTLMQNISITRVGNVESYFSVKEIDIISKEKDKENNLVKVICDVTMSNNEINAEVQYNVFCKETEGRWDILNSAISTIYDIKPLQGADEPTDMVESIIKGYYPEINWGYQQANFLGNDINYDFPIYWKLSEKNTNLEDKEEQFVYEYSFNTHTAHVKGSVEFNYEFTEDGVWTVIETNQKTNNIDWNVEGVWCFDIFTYYIDVAIMDMDFENHVATVQRRGGIYRGAGEIETVQVGFIEDGCCLCFDTFIISGSGVSEKDHEVTLTAKLDDLYYRGPSLFSGAKPYDIGIGGKSK